MSTVNAKTSSVFLGGSENNHGYDRNEQARRNNKKPKIIIRRVKGKIAQITKGAVDE